MADETKLAEQLKTAQDGLRRALDYRAATPEGLAIKADVREALRRSGYTGALGECDDGTGSAAGGRRT